MGTMTVLAGTPLAIIQAAAEEAGLYFPLDLGARGSCTIGGNISTNAGGNRVIRYGMARDQVLGLEYVLPDGSSVSSLNKMIKNNAAYDLKQLLIGSEGTLGVITRAVLRLQAKPISVASAMCGCAYFEAVLELLKAARSSLGPSLSSFEVMWPSFVDTMTEGLPHLRRPFAQAQGVYVLIEASGFHADAEAGHLEACLSTLLESGVLKDVVADWTSKQFDPTLNWGDIASIRKRWGGKLILKGIQDVEDARLAAGSGADALIVSNHGGRQLDGAPSSITALPAIVDAVGHRIEVHMDG